MKVVDALAADAADGFDCHAKELAVSFKCYCDAAKPTVRMCNTAVPVVSYVVWRV